MFCSSFKLFQITNPAQLKAFKCKTVSSILLFDGYVDDVKCEYSFSAAAAFDDGTLDGTLAPGKKMLG